MPPDPHNPAAAEARRLQQDDHRQANWKRWGPYLAERQWATVREDYSPDSSPWTYFPHDHARSRAYRWGEDGLLGITDRECRLCFALALWNTHDPILKERLFGLTGPEGNHGEDVKEAYFYLDATPTHSYLKARYKYPHAPFPYHDLVATNAHRARHDPEYELADTGIFNDSRYFDVQAEYAKASPDDILIRLTITNRAPAGSPPAPLHILPTLWFRNTWTWGCANEDCQRKPALWADLLDRIVTDHPTLGQFYLCMDPATPPDDLLFTENETNRERLYHAPSASPYVKDAFHRWLIAGETAAVNPKRTGTKAAVHYRATLAPGQSITLRLRLCPNALDPNAAFSDFNQIFATRLAEADAFHAHRLPAHLTPEHRAIARQAAAGLLWSKQFYHYAVREWLQGDPDMPPPPRSRRHGRNHDWPHLFNRDVISMPDKWEYPWYASWDLAFHMIPFAKLDPTFAKEQLLLLLREWYMHPSGQIPAYEFALSDANPPVHAWACWRVYKMTAPRGQRDLAFLARAFHKLLINFTWWVNRKDVAGKHIFAGGFLGLDNIGVFDRSTALPSGATVEQADGTAWMAFFCATMLAIALELAAHDPVYEDVASKFFEHFIAIVDAINSLDGTGLWDETDGFYYDHLRADGASGPVRIRSIVGLIPLIAVEVLEQPVIAQLPGFRKRMDWFLTHRADLARNISYMQLRSHPDCGHYLLALPSQQRLASLLRYMLDENEFLSPFGVRSLSRVHAGHPYVFHFDGQELRVSYAPGESDTALFGGNSNWRGPVWFPVNFLLIEALERYHHFYTDDFQVECPTGSGRLLSLAQVSQELRRRLVALFLPDASGRRPCFGPDPRFASDPHWKDLLLFHEYFHADTGRGLGASHQTGWTALITRCIEELLHPQPDSHF